MTQSCTISSCSFCSVDTLPDRDPGGMLAQGLAGVQGSRGTVGGEFVHYMVITALLIQAAAVHTSSHYPHLHK